MVWRFNPFTGKLDYSEAGGAETDPIWTSDKNNYYTKTETDGLLATKLGVNDKAADSDKVDGYEPSETPTAGKIPVADTNGKLDNWITLGNSIEEGDLNFSDVTTGNATTLRHGLLPKLSGVETEFLNGLGEWASVSGGGQVIFDCVVDASGGGDYTDLKSAIDDGKKLIFVKPGTYTLSADITIANDNTAIIGSGWATIISCGNYKININGKSNFRIENCKLTGTNTSNGIIYNGTSGANMIVVRGCYIDANYPIEITTGTNVFICENYITGITAKYGIRGAQAFSFYILNNYIYNIGTSTSTSGNVYGIYGGYVIANNYISGVGHNNIDCSRGTGIYGGAYIISNYIYDVRSNQLTGTAAGIENGSYVLYNDIEVINNLPLYAYGISGIYKMAVGNYISHIGSWSYTSTAYGIYSTDNDLVISQNRITNINAKSGGTVGYIFCGNYEIVSNNSLGTISTGATNRYGIYVSSGSIIKDNCFNYASSLTEPIKEDGTNNICRNNSGLWGLVYEKDYIYAKNTSGSTISAGMLVVLKSVANGYEITTTTTAGDPKVIGMASGNINDNSFGYVQVLGKTTLLKVNGTTDISVGDFISTYTEAGIGKKASAGETAIAIALEDYTNDDSSGVIDAILIPPRTV